MDQDNYQARIPYPIIDMHTHLRDNIPLGIRVKNPNNEGNVIGKVAKQGKVDIFLYMANTNPPLDNLETIKSSLSIKRNNCRAIPVAAITKNLEGKEPVNIEEIKPYVAGFSDDGKCLYDLEILEYVLKKKVLVLAHCEPETEMIEKYLSVIERVGGYLHIQHISRKSSVDLIRRAKKSGIDITCETCPQYFIYTYNDKDLILNPPLGNEMDVLAIKKGLRDGTIDVITSDHAPHDDPLRNGLRGLKTLVSLSYGLVLAGVLSEQALWSKLTENPRKIIKKNRYEI